MSTPTIAADALHYSKTDQPVEDQTVITNTGVVTDDLLMFEVVTPSPLRDEPIVMDGHKLKSYYGLVNADLPPDTGDKIRVNTETGEVTPLNFERSGRFEEVRQMIEDFEPPEYPEKPQSLVEAFLEGIRDGREEASYEKPSPRQRLLVQLLLFAVGMGLFSAVSSRYRSHAKKRLLSPLSGEEESRSWFNWFRLSPRQNNAATLVNVFNAVYGADLVDRLLKEHTDLEPEEQFCAGGLIGLASGSAVVYLAKKLL